MSQIEAGIFGRMEVMSDAISGIEVWNGKFSGREIPGSTRVPVQEIANYFHGRVAGLKGLDLGSGSGRSTSILSESLGCDVKALDLSFSGLRETDPTLDRVMASGLELPFKADSFDFISVCGVMTNLVDRDPKESVNMRRRLIEELVRTARSGGIVVISDFLSDHNLTGYPVDYDRHKLITGELGTIAVFKPESQITFKGRSDNDVAQLANSPHLMRFAHHYSVSELTGLLQNGGFKVRLYTVEVGQTPSGREIENIIVTSVKPSDLPVAI